VESHGDDDDAGCGQLLTRTPEISGSPTSTEGGMDEEVKILPIGI
jgi:hypothetical protein